MSLRTLTAAACGAAAGLGTWATLGSLDRMQGPDGSVRVAMLPSLGTLVLLVLAGLVLFAFIHLALSRLRPAAGVAAPLVVLAGGGVLVLPYLPWLPDLAPALMLLAGPGALMAWGVLVGLAVWSAALETHLSRRSPPRVEAETARAVTAGAALARRRRWTTAILLASLASSGVLAERFTRTPLFPGGDEPHYLVIAQSLWRDGDLRIENNHTRGDYDEYFHRPLAPHYLTRGTDREIYSIHPVGMPVLMTPVYAAGGYDLVVRALVLLAAIAMTSAWRLAWAVTGSASAATFGWAALALGPPWIFNTFAVYPEVPAACAVALAFAWTSGWHAERDAHRRPLDVPVWRWWAAGLAIACLPWFSTKYLVMGAMLGLVSLLRAWWPWPPDGAARTRAVVRTLALGVPNVVSLAGWFLFFKVIWGTWSPTAPYGTQRETRLEYLPAGGPGLLFDQEYGIVAFAPVLLMVLPGLYALWRQRGARRRLALELVLVFTALLGVVGAFHIWWGGSAIVGRPLVSALPLLVLPVAAHWTACARQPLRRAAQRVLLGIGIAVTVVLATAQSGLLLVAGRDGTSQVLEYLAPSTPVWTLVPTFLRQPPLDASLGVLLWAGVALLAGRLLGRATRRAHEGPTARATDADVRRFRIGRDQLAGWIAVIGAGALVSAVAAQALPPATPAPSLEERPRVRLLDEYDAERRPLAMRYDPLTRIDAATVPGLFPLLVHEAGDRREDRATQLFGRRLSLPAGTYGVDMLFPASAVPIDAALAVHAGRTSPALRTWPVALTSPGSWGRAFSLPVDVGFVGFKASPELADASPRLRLTPQTIVDASARPRTPAVLASARYGDLVILVHGEDAWPERDGLWVRGRASSTLTIVGPPRNQALTLRAGPQPVEVTVAWDGGEIRASLAAGQSQDVTLPATGARQDPTGTIARQLRITTSSGFVPAEVEPGSRDRRMLGCWITFHTPPGRQSAR